jgi:uncharacterized surface protein with fasciclin (FAS1) repeats
LQGLNVIDTAIRSGIFQTFTRLLEGSPLEAQLRTKDQFTLFAPIDKSFAYLPPDTLTRLLKAESQGILSDVLGYHVAFGKFTSWDLSKISKTPTVYGIDLNINNLSATTVEGAKLLHVDLLARNGVIHGIDRLLLPKRSAAAASR